MNVTLLTTTFYKSPIETRAILAHTMVESAIGAGYKVLVIDGSPPDSGVTQSLKGIGAQVFPQNVPGMGPSRRQLFRAAMNITRVEDSPIFVWLEPEKVDLVRSVPAIVEPIRQGVADVVIPARTQKSWESYPSFQVASEQKANEVYREVTGRALDSMFGPVAFNDSVISYFAGCNPADYGVPGGYIQLLAPLKIMAMGNPITSVLVDFCYPSVQKAEEESGLREEMIQKRQWQLDQLVESWRAMGKVLGLNPSA